VNGGGGENRNQRGNAVDTAEPAHDSVPSAKLEWLSTVLPELVAEGRHDSLPGLPDGVPVKVKVEVDPGEGIVTVDLRDNIDCVAVGVNLSQTCATAGALIGVLNCIDPSVPRNEGSFRRIRILLKENCVVGIPRFPASTSMATSNVTNRLINATQRAFSMLGDGYGLAEGAASMGAGFGVVSGFDRRHGNEPYVNQLVIGNNGGPGAPGCDGWVTYCMPDAAASVMVDSAEIIEQKYPLMIRSLRLVADSGGAGRFRGGPAGEIVYGPLHDPMTVAYFAEMHEDPPKGTRGGGEGSRSRVSKISRDGSEEPLPPIGLVELQPGELIRGLEAGGGGYGDPMERDPNRVRHDVLEGWITLPAARDTYGVVLKGSSEDGSLAVDGSATTSLRQELAGRRP